MYKPIRALGPILLFIYVLPGRSAGAPADEQISKHDSHAYRDLPEQSACELKNSSDAVECALRNDPEIRIRYREYQSQKAAIQEAEQIPNPTLSAKLYPGDGGSGELEYRHIIELGNRRELRGDVARSRARRSALLLELTRQNVVLHTVLHLHRLKQIAEEEDFLEKSRAAFNAAIYRLGRLPARSANQQVSLESFIMARDAVEQRKVALQEEREDLALNLEQSFGIPLTADQLHKIMAAHPARWPKLPGSWENALQLQVAAQEVGSATAQFRLEQRQVWPDFRIGPNLSYAKEAGSFLNSGRSRWEAGIGFEFTIPLYQQNEGGEARANAHRDLAQTKSGIAERKIRQTFRRLRKRYQFQIRALQKNPSPAVMARRRNRILGYLRRGLVSPALLIEYHRTYGEYLQSFHRTQLEALRTLWKCYALTGRILDENIRKNP